MRHYVLFLCKYWKWTEAPVTLVSMCFCMFFSTVVESACTVLFSHNCSFVCEYLPAISRSRRFLFTLPTCVRASICGRMLSLRTWYLANRWLRCSWEQTHWLDVEAKCGGHGKTKYGRISIFGILKIIQTSSHKHLFWLRHTDEQFAVDNHLINVIYSTAVQKPSFFGWKLGVWLSRSYFSKEKT